MNQEIDFQKMLHINKNLLDEELVGQAQRMMTLSSRHAQAQYDRDRTKQSLDVKRAELDSSIRSELTAAGTKFTEAVVDGNIRRHPAYLEAQEKFFKSEHEVSLIFGAVMAMNARRDMLESLVKLFLSGYYSEPRLTGQGTDMKAGAAMNATEEAALRTAAAFPPASSEPPRPAIAPRPTPRVPPKA